MILSLDSDLDNFFTWLDQNIGLSNVWLALTADHGIAPIPGDAAKLGIHGVALDMLKVYTAVDAELNERHSPGQKLHYLLPNPDLPYVVLDKRVFQKRGIDEEKAEREVAEILPGIVAAQNPNAPPFMTDKSLTKEPSEKRLQPGPRVEDVYT